MIKSGCLQDNSKCLVHDLWDGLTQHIYDYFKSISLETVCTGRVKEAFAQTAGVSA